MSKMVISSKGVEQDEYHNFGSQPRARISPAIIFGIIIISFGLLIFAYNAIVAPISIAKTDGSRILNAGLMNDRECGIISGGILILFGGIMMVYGKIK